MGGTEGHACVFVVLDESWAGQPCVESSPGLISAHIWADAVERQCLSGVLTPKCKQMQDGN